MKLNTLFLLLVVLLFFNQCKGLPGSKHKRQPKQFQNNNQPNNTAVNKGSNQVLSDTSAKPETNKNPFGILVDRTDNANIPADKKIQVAKALGFNYMRTRVYINTWDGTIPDYDNFTAAGFKIILNINYGLPRNGFGDKQPVPFPTDMQAYSQTLTSILDKYKPELVVIENEEDNPGYHSGSADDYINELKTAIAICHSKGIKVTNGGLTVRETGLLTYDDLMHSGKLQQAADFAANAVPQKFLSKLNNYENVPMIQRALTFGRQVMQAYKTLDLDYVNFHWYEPVAARGGNNDLLNSDHIDPAVFNAVVNYITRTTGKPVITNEFGVLNTSTTLIQELMQQVLNANMDYAIFYSGNGAGGSQALQNSDASLRQNGIAVRDFIQQHCKKAN